jgi:hypothetical protein
MGRQKKISFKLNPEWMFKEPIDFEYNKYTLLGYLQKCEEKFNNLEIYPDFIEISLHLANAQSLHKENILLLTDKKFESCDDEILLKELIPKKPRELTKSEEIELEKTLNFSRSKLFDTFNIGKSIWNLAYENLEVSMKKNREINETSKGYIFFYRKSENLIYVWSYEIKNPKKEFSVQKTRIKEIYKGPPSDLTLNYIIDTYSTWRDKKNYAKYPIFEAKCEHDFPLEQTLIPILKRKISAYIQQVSELKKINFFDSLK